MTGMFSLRFCSDFVFVLAFLSVSYLVIAVTSWIGFYAFR
ncbi:hypothetical protein AALP_AAs44202U000100 [Arabis alpina]|uniref:Uncharacterized protein n=1 Tax=Arabis alpina TaxID=50452 RepID=A0A087FX27_ARAAL|nr:hypothetical protein AALP_AAs44202U000100 [Arabis alpina]